MQASSIAANLPVTPHDGAVSGPVGTNPTGQTFAQTLAEKANGSQLKSTAPCADSDAPVVRAESSTKDGGAAVPSAVGPTKAPGKKTGTANMAATSVATTASGSPLEMNPLAPALAAPPPNQSAPTPNPEAVQAAGDETGQPTAPDQSLERVTAVYDLDFRAIADIEPSPIAGNDGTATAAATGKTSSGTQEIDGDGSDTPAQQTPQVGVEQDSQNDGNPVANRESAGHEVASIKRGSSSTATDSAYDLILSAEQERTSAQTQEQSTAQPPAPPDARSSPIVPQDPAAGRGQAAQWTAGQHEWISEFRPANEDTRAVSDAVPVKRSGAAEPKTESPRQAGLAGEFVAHVPLVRSVASSHAERNRTPDADGILQPMNTATPESQDTQNEADGASREVSPLDDEELPAVETLRPGGASKAQGKGEINRVFESGPSATATINAGTGGQAEPSVSTNAALGRELHSEKLPGHALPAGEGTVHEANAVTNAAIAGNNEQSEIHVALTGGKLGTVEVHARVSGEQLGAAIVVEKKEAHAALAVELPALREALSDKNLHVEHIWLTQGFGNGLDGDAAGPFRDATKNQDHMRSGTDGPEKLGQSRSVSAVDVEEIYDSKGHLSIRV